MATKPPLTKADVSHMIELGASATYLSSLLKASGLDVNWVPLSTTRKTNSALSSSERAILRSGGARLDKGSLDQATAQALLLELVTESRRLISDAYDTKAVANLMGESESDVERDVHRVPPRFHGIQLKTNRLVLPGWQFTESGPIPHLESMLSFVTSLNPLTLSRFMLTPHQDLEHEDQRISPREWLVRGYEPGPVLDLVKFLISD